MATYVSPTDSRGYYTSLVINEVSRDITNNTTFIYYEYRLHSGPHNYFQSFGSTINLTIDGVTLLNTTTQSVSFQSPFYNTSVLLTNGNRTISHNADGTRSISFSSSFRTNSTTTFTPIPTHTISGSQALTTIPRASTPTLNVSSQALGSAITINTNRASASFTHTLKYAFGSEQGTIATGVGDSTSWTLPNTLANAIPNGTSGSGTITCETYNGSTLIGTRTVAFTATVPNNATFQPNASISSITEGQSGLSAFSVFIQNISRLRVQSASSGKFGASISQIRVTIDGVHYWGADITSNTINRNGVIEVTLLVTDSRGYSTSVVWGVTLVAYFTPRINGFSASRTPNDQSTNLSASVNFDVAPISNQNGKHYRIRYRVVGGSWVLLFESYAYYSRTFTHTSNGVLDANNSYEIELYVADNFASAVQSVIVTTAFDLLNFNQSGKGLAIGKVSEGDNFEVDLHPKFNKQFLSTIYGMDGTGNISGEGRGTSSFEAYSNASNAAYMTFHRAGSHAIRFGLDTDNQLKVGGWSLAPNSYPLIHTGNHQLLQPYFISASKLDLVANNGVWTSFFTFNSTDTETGFIHTTLNGTLEWAIGIYAKTWNGGQSGLEIFKIWGTSGIQFGVSGNSIAVLQNNYGVPLIVRARLIRGY